MPSIYCLDFILKVLDNLIYNPLEDFGELGDGESSPELELDEDDMIVARTKKKKSNTQKLVSKRIIALIL